MHLLLKVVWFKDGIYLSRYIERKQDWFFTHIFLLATPTLVQHSSYPVERTNWTFFEWIPRGIVLKIVLAAVRVGIDVMSSLISSLGNWLETMVITSFSRSFRNLFESNRNNFGKQSDSESGKLSTSVPLQTAISTDAIFSSLPTDCNEFSKLLVTEEGDPLESDSRKAGEVFCTCRCLVRTKLVECVRDYICRIWFQI